MSRYLSTLLILLALVVGTVGVAPTAHAQFFDAMGNEYPTQEAASAADTAGNALAQTALDANAEQAANAAGAVGTGNGQPAVNPDPDSPYNIVMQKIMGLFAWLVGAAALTLDYAMYYTVVNMGSYVKQLSAIGVTWQILRDIGNIMLIFGFLAVGITTILSVDWYGSGTKMLPKMLMAAVFLNFSLFITEAIIDTGNLFATQFYTQINGASGALNRPSMPGSFSDLTNLGQQQGISSKIMNRLGLQTIYGNGTVNPELFAGANPWFVGFMGILLFIVTAFVLFSLAFVLIARFIALIFLIILAPIGFAGLAVPQLAARAKKWWDTLFEQTITAPVLLLMLYIALRVITDAQFLTGLAGTASPDYVGWVGIRSLDGFASTLLSFIVAMGLLIAVVIQSKNLSAFGASWASQTAGKLSFGLTAWGVNRTVGRGAYRLQRVARQSKAFNTFDAFTGRALSRTMDKAATGSFDVRGSKAFGNLKVDAGKAAEGGFIGARKRNIEDHEKAVKGIETAHKEANWDNKKEIETATSNRERAESGYGIQKKEYDAATQEVKDRQAEVARLEEEKKRDKYFTESGGQAKLDAAKASLEESAKKQDSLKQDLDKLGDIVENLKKVEENAKKPEAAGKRMSESMKENKIAYAENIDHLWNPITYIAYGPNSGAAARKIKESIKEKPDKDKLVELIKKMNKEGEEKPKEDKKPEEGKPEAPKP